MKPSALVYTRVLYCGVAFVRDALPPAGRRLVDQLTGRIQQHQAGTQSGED